MNHITSRGEIGILTILAYPILKVYQAILNLATRLIFLGRALEQDVGGGEERLSRKATLPVAAESRNRYPGRNRQQISSKTLTSAQVSVLKRGFGFVPTYSGDKLETDIEMERFFRIIRLKGFFHLQGFQMDQDQQRVEAESTKYDCTRCRPKSRFLPPLTNASIKTFVKSCQMDIDRIQWKKKYKSNLSKSELLTLRVLKEDLSLSIRPADKGGALVVMDTQKYLVEMDQQLTNVHHYRILDDDPA
ncbi:Hypothetical predicted protein, partial [Pelobates cultripes]